MWTAIITVAVQLLGWFLERAKIKNELAKEFFAWAERLGADQGSSQLRRYGFKQWQYLTDTPWQESK